ncbi:MAG: alpha-galactosidase, partial [Spirochaetales bacterium]
MPKIAIIGAGSIIFATTLINDMLGTDCLKDSTYALMGPTKWKLERVETWAKNVILKNKLGAKVYSTTDRRDALKGADYVVVPLQVGGMEAYKIDYEIPLKYGVDQCLGQCVGPGGVFRGARSIPVLASIMKDMEELCPHALLLNYVNPMATNSIGMGKSSKINFIGLCHGVQTTLDLIAGYTNCKKSEIDFICAGINHMAWFLKIEKDGKDLYPLLKANCEKPEYFVNDKVRCETMRHFGYFMTESTGHLSEYLPWFRKNQKALDLYCDQPAFGGESGAYYKYCDMIAKKFEKGDFMRLASDDLEPRSKDYCSFVIESLETGKLFVLNGNIMNTEGYIENLPRDCCVEVPIFVDKNGLHPSYVGKLPAQLAALNMMDINVQLMASEAALEGDVEKLMMAAAFDPLTSAVLTLQETRDMVAEMLEAQRKWLPQFEGKKIRPLGNINTPKGLKPAEVPLDPALAIANRFG